MTLNQKLRVFWNFLISLDYENPEFKSQYREKAKKLDLTLADVDRVLQAWCTTMDNAYPEFMCDTHIVSYGGKTITIKVIHQQSH